MAGRALAARIKQGKCDITVFCVYFPSNYNEIKGMYKILAVEMAKRIANTKERTAIIGLIDGNCHVGIEREAGGMGNREAQDVITVGKCQPEEMDEAGSVLKEMLEAAEMTMANTHL